MESSSPTKRFRRRRVALVVVVMALLGGAWWWGTQPRVYRPVASFPVYHDKAAWPWPLYSSALGVLARQSPDAYAFYDWHGAPRWTVTAATPSLAGFSPFFAQGSADYDGGRIICLSPDGHYLAIAAFARPRALRVQTWRDGTLVGDVTVPVRPAECAKPLSVYDYCCRKGSTTRNMAVTDAGRVWLTIPSWAGFRLLALEGGRVMAKGGYLYPTPIGKGLFWTQRAIAADGTALALEEVGGVQRTTVFNVRVRGARVLLAKRFSLSQKYGFIAADGSLLQGDGMIYRDATPLTAPVGVQCLSPGGMSGVQVARKRRVATVVSLRGTERWTLRGRDLLSAAAPVVSEDGRYLLVRHPHAAAQRLGDFLLRFARYPSLATMAIESGIPLKSRTYLALYERPGRLRAVLANTGVQSASDGRVHLTYQGVSYQQIGNFSASPDLRAIAFYLTRNPSATGTENVCVIYRWK